MAINISGSTSAAGALANVPAGGKTICLMGLGGTGATATDTTVFAVDSVATALSKWGDTSETAKIAKYLLMNGVTLYGMKVKAVTGGDTIAGNYQKCLDELMKHTYIGILLTESVDATVQTAVKNHLILAESEDKLRYYCAGVDGAVSNPVTNAELTARATVMNYPRVFIPGPHVMVDGTLLGGAHSAAALAIIIALETDDPALPVNGVFVQRGYNGVNVLLLKTEKDALVTGGVTPLYADAYGRPTVYRLVTTYTKNAQSVADITWQEGSTILTADNVLKSVMNRIRANYTRTKNIPRILNSIRTDVLDVLTEKARLEYIENLNTDAVTVRKNPADFYGAIVEYEFDVVTPLYNITIKQSMRL